MGFRPFMMRNTSNYLESRFWIPHFSDKKLRFRHFAIIAIATDWKTQLRYLRNCDPLSKAQLGFAIIAIFAIYFTASCKLQTRRGYLAECRCNLGRINYCQEISNPWAILSINLENSGSNLAIYPQRVTLCYPKILSFDEMTTFFRISFPILVKRVILEGLLTQKFWGWRQTLSSCRTWKPQHETPKYCASAKLARQSVH